MYRVTSTDPNFYSKDSLVPILFALVSLPFDEFKEYVENHPDEINQIDPKSAIAMSVLMLAVSNSSGLFIPAITEQTVEFLITKGANVNYSPFHFSVLKSAIESGDSNLKTIELLLEAGSDIHHRVEHLFGPGGDNALTIALNMLFNKSRDVDHTIQIIKMLIDYGADINDSDILNVLFDRSSRRRTMPQKAMDEMLKILIQNDFNINCQPVPVLFMYLEMNYGGSGLKLLLDAGAEVNIRPEWCHRHQMAIDSDADPDADPDADAEDCYCTALAHVKDKTNIECIELLLQAGATKAGLSANYLRFLVRIENHLKLIEEQAEKIEDLNNYIMSMSVKAVKAVKGARFVDQSTRGKLKIQMKIKSKAKIED